MIKKVKEGYRVVAESGRNMGTYATKEEAERRLRQVEYFKRRKQPKKGYSTGSRSLLAGRSISVTIPLRQ